MLQFPAGRPQGLARPVSPLLPPAVPLLLAGAPVWSLIAPYSKVHLLVTALQSSLSPRSKTAAPWHSTLTLLCVSVPFLPAGHLCIASPSPRRRGALRAGILSLLLIAGQAGRCLDGAHPCREATAASGGAPPGHGAEALFSGHEASRVVPLVPSSFPLPTLCGPGDPTHPQPHSASAIPRAAGAGRRWAGLSRQSRAPQPPSGSSGGPGVSSGASANRGARGRRPHKHRL